MYPAASALEAALAAQPAGPVLTGAVRSALGVDPARPLGPGVPVHDYHLETDRDLVRVWVVLDRLLVLCERNTSGTTLSVAVPLQRVRRVSELDVPAERLVMVELDAFPTTLEPGPDGRTRMNATVLEIRADTADARARLAAFSRTLRARLGS